MRHGRSIFLSDIHLGTRACKADRLIDFRREHSAERLFLIGDIRCLDKHTTGDGIVSALQVLAALRRSGKALADYAKDCPHFPQELINVKVKKGFKLDERKEVWDAVAQVEAELKDEGRVVLRPSGTEPLIRGMVEGRKAAEVRQAAERIAEVVKVAAGA